MRLHFTFNTNLVSQLNLWIEKYINTGKTLINRLLEDFCLTLHVIQYLSVWTNSWHNRNFFSLLFCYNISLVPLLHKPIKLYFINAYFQLWIFSKKGLIYGIFLNVLKQVREKSLECIQRTSQESKFIFEL